MSGDPDIFAAEKGPVTFWAATTMGVLCTPKIAKDFIKQFWENEGQNLGGRGTLAVYPTCATHLQTLYTAFWRAL